MLSTNPFSTIFPDIPIYEAVIHQPPLRDPAAPLSYLSSFELSRDFIVSWPTPCFRFPDRRLALHTDQHMTSSLHTGVAHHTSTKETSRHTRLYFRSPNRPPPHHTPLPYTSQALRPTIVTHLVLRITTHGITSVC